MIKSLLKNRVEIPAADEDSQLIALAQNGDIAARNQIVVRHLPFMLWFARKCKRALTPHHLDIDDLTHCCVLGTIDAVRKYNPHKANGRFIHYAQFWMRHHINREIDRGKLYRVPPSVLALYKNGKLESPKSEATKRAVKWFRDLRALPDEYQAESREISPAVMAELNETLQLYERATNERG